MHTPVSYGAPRNKRTVAYALAAASMFVVMLVAQLFGFEEFPLALSTVVATNDASALEVLAGCVVLAELLTLPFLLGMYISLLMRIVSAFIGFCIAAFWLFVAFTNAHTANVGYFSDSITLPGGLIAAIWAIILFSLVCKVIFADSRFRHATS